MLFVHLLHVLGVDANLDVQAAELAALGLLVVLLQTSAVVGGVEYDSRMKVTSMDFCGKSRVLYFNGT